MHWSYNRVPIYWCMQSYTSIYGNWRYTFPKNLNIVRLKLETFIIKKKTFIKNLYILFSNYLMCTYKKKLLNHFKQIYETSSCLENFNFIEALKCINR